MKFFLFNLNFIFSQPYVPDNLDYFAPGIISILCLVLVIPYIIYILIRGVKHELKIKEFKIIQDRIEKEELENLEKRLIQEKNQKLMFQQYENGIKNAVEVVSIHWKMSKKDAKEKVISYIKDGVNPAIFKTENEFIEAILRASYKENFEMEKKNIKGLKKD
jgi:hypothetical protein